MDIIQANYDLLAQVASDFGQQMDAIEDLQRRVRQGYAPLNDGAWQGQGIAAFSSEMDGEIFPALQRLSLALGEGQSVTLEIAKLLRQAEEEAAAPFKGSADGGTSGGGAGGAGSTAGGGLAPGSGNGGAPTTTGGSSGLAAIGDYLKRTFVDNAEHGGYFNLFDSEDGKARGLGYNYSTDMYAPDGLKWENIGGSPIGGQIKLGSLEGTAGIGTGKDGFEAGLGGSFTGAQGGIEGVFGDRNLALTGGVKVTALGAEGTAGYRNGSIGLGGELNGASIGGDVGANIAGYNVGVTASAGLKLGLGVSVGKNTEIKLGPFSIGLSLGGAKE